MTSGRVQLSVTGIQDVFLTGSPDITYFQKMFQRHTKFSLELLDNPFQQQTIDFGNTIRATVERRGDLIRSIYFKFELSPLVDASSSNIGYTDSVGHAIIDYADLIIGGQTIERITGEYMEIYSELCIPDEQQRGLEVLVGKTGSRTGLGPAVDTMGTYGAYPRTFFVHLPFYFARNDPLAIPLSAITYQEVEVVLKLRNLDELVVTPDPPGSVTTISGSILNASLPVEYVFLSPEENEFMQSKRIDYVITQLQLAKGVIPANQTESSFRLEFINPVKEFYFVIQNQSNVSTNVYTGNDWFNYNNTQNTNNLINHQLNSVQLDFNNETYLHSEVADTSFLYAIQPMNRHTRVPRRLFYNYSFSLDPENYLPTGQVNMSRIQNKIIKLYTSTNTETRDVRIYAKSYNVLRVENGITGLLFIDNNHI